MGFFSKKVSDQDKLEKGLIKSKTGFFSKLQRIVQGKSQVDTNLLDELEEALLTADVGVNTTIEIIDRIEARVSKDKYLDLAELNTILREEIQALLNKNESSPEEFDVTSSPYVIMVVGVNGAGKTTTIGKLAHTFQKEGKQVTLGAADTFRAAAIDQLQVWADRVGCNIVKQKMGSDPASVAYDTLQSAKSKNADVVIVDTAGRLHNKVNLINELSKIKKVMDKIIPDAPHEVLLVLDGSTGQNAFQQARQFSETTEVTGLVVTKLDGTAKGGVLIGISNELQIPIRYIGIGEGIEDLQPFDAQQFVSTLFSFE